MVVVGFRSEVGMLTVTISRRAAESSPRRRHIRGDDGRTQAGSGERRDRARLAFRARAAMCDFKAYSARRARSSGASAPFGSTCSSNRARKAAVPALVDVPPIACSAYAAARARSVRCVGVRAKKTP